MKDPMITLMVWAVLIGGVLLFYFVKRSINLKKAQSSEDKMLIKERMNQFINGQEDQLVYAHYEEQESYGRTVRTTFFRYIVVFYEKTLKIFPMRLDKKTREVQIAQPIVLSAENLGKINVTAKRKENNVKYAEVWLGDKQGHRIIEFRVDALNLRRNKYFPVNLIQQEECDEFEKFITDLSKDVAKENPRIDLVMANQANAGLGTLGIVLSAAGGIVSILFPPLGLILCMIGFGLSLAGKLKGSSNKISFIVCTLLMIGSILFCVFYYTVMFG